MAFAVRLKTDAETVIHSLFCYFVLPLFVLVFSVPRNSLCSSACTHCINRMLFGGGCMYNDCTQSKNKFALSGVVARGYAVEPAVC